jgi:ATP-dependent Clp protease ATP-binding subunit ClpA
VRELRRALDEFERRQVARALAEGASFADVGRELGCSRQAAHRRFRGLAPTQGQPLLPTPDVRIVLRYAREEAVRLHAGGVGSEHVLLAVLRAGDGPAAGALREAGITLEKARGQLEALAPDSSLFTRPTAAPDLRALLAEPAREALRRGDRAIEAEHLLLGALGDAGGAARTLRALGADPRRVRAAVGALLD